MQLESAKMQRTFFELPHRSKLAEEFPRPAEEAGQSSSPSIVAIAVAAAFLAFLVTDALARESTAVAVFLAVFTVVGAVLVAGALIAGAVDHAQRARQEDIVRAATLAVILVRAREAHEPNHPERSEDLRPEAAALAIELATQLVANTTLLDYFMGRR